MNLSAKPDLGPAVEGTAWQQLPRDGHSPSLDRGDERQSIAMDGEGTKNLQNPFRSSSHTAETLHLKRPLPPLRSCERPTWKNFRPMCCMSLRSFRSVCRELGQVSPAKDPRGRASMWAAPPSLTISMPRQCACIHPGSSITAHPFGVIEQSTMMSTESFTFHDKHIRFLL